MEREDIGEQALRRHLRKGPPPEHVPSRAEDPEWIGAGNVDSQHWRGTPPGQDHRLTIDAIYHALTTRLSGPVPSGPCFVAAELRLHRNPRKLRDYKEPDVMAAPADADGVLRSRLIPFGLTVQENGVRVAGTHGVGAGDGRVAADAVPLAVHSGATVADAAAALHKALGTACHVARLWGPPARFDGQLVGREHRLQDDDTVEIVS